MPGFKVSVDWKLCNGDEICVQVCPVGVYEMQVKVVDGEEKKVSVPVNADECIGCMACATQCPTGAITVEPE